MYKTNMRLKIAEKTDTKCRKFMRRRLEKSNLGFSACYFGQFKLHFVQYIL